MPEHRTDRAQPERGARLSRLGMPAGLLAALVITILAFAGVGARYCARGDFDAIHAVLSLFFSINLLICYFEACLFLKRDYIEARTEYWRARRDETGRTPAVQFLLTKVPLTKALSPTVWADIWATYAQFDSSYADRRTYGFNVDIANGFATPVPTLLLYAAYTFDILPALAAGIIGVMLFWQLTYMTSVYLVSFFVANRQARISRGELYIYILAMNAPWILCPLLGLYVSVRLILDGDYSVLGY